MNSPLARFKIDWTNHIIGFFSALFGILIAFELDEWREQRNQQELARIAFETLKKEIQINQNLLHENVKNNLKYVHALQRLLDKMDHQLRYIGLPSEIDSLNLKFGKIIFIEKDDKQKETGPVVVHIGMSNLYIPALQSSAWESAKATGALNLMDYEKVLSLSFVYNHPRILDELNDVRATWRNSDNVTTKPELTNLLNELEKSHQALEREFTEYDQFINILNAMD